MSGSHDPRRLLEYGDELNGVLKNALEAERAEPDVDEARLRRIEQGIAAAVGAGVVAPKAPWLSTKAQWVLATAALAIGVSAVGLHVGDDTASPRISRSPSALVSERRHLELGSAAAPLTLRPEDLPAAPSAAQTPSPHVTAPAAVVVPTEADEIALLARAHDALRANPGDALALCAEHEKTFASGHFAQEREAVAIEALVYLGRKEEAKKRFASFQRLYPSSSHRAHLEILLAP